MCESTGKNAVYGSLREANAARQKLWGAKDPMFAAVELAGEVGEALNVVKKLERERLGMAGSRATKQDLADELGDVAICLDLLAASLGVDLERATAEKFNKTSAKMGFPVKLFVRPALEPKAEPSPPFNTTGFS